MCVHRTGAVLNNLCTLGGTQICTKPQLEAPCKLSSNCPAIADLRCGTRNNPCLRVSLFSSTFTTDSFLHEPLNFHLRDDAKLERQSVEPFSQEAMSTVTVPSYLSMPEDVHILHRAFKGFGCDEKKVIQILAHRTQLQRLAIADAYNAQYGESIHKRLKSELKGKLETAMRLWMMGPAQRDAILIYEATQGVGTKDRGLIGIICTRTPSQIYEIKQAYHSLYQKPLERQIDGDTSGDYKKLLLALTRGIRSETTAMDPNLALADAEALYRAGEARMGTNEDIIIHILTTRSPAQLNMTLHYYRQNFRGDFEKAIQKETSGRFENALLAVVQSTCNPAKYFAQEIVDSTKGLGTKDDDLIRVITTRAELDMYYIKQEFLALTNKPLEQVIASETSGDYQHFLLSLVGGIN